MADWFETRFREGAERAPMDPAFAERVRALVVEEWQADDRDTRSDGTETHLDEGDIIMLDTEDRAMAGAPAEPPRRRRWPLAAAAAAVLAVVLVGTAVAGDDDRDVDTAGQTGEGTSDAPDQVVVDVMAVPFLEPIEPGTYAIDPDADDATSMKVLFDVPEGWESWLGAVRFANRGHVALSIVEVENLVAEGCRGHYPADPPVGPTVEDLASALTALAPFEVTSPPAAVDLLGHTGVHLQLRVPDLPTEPAERSSDRAFATCTGGQLHSWYAPNLDGAYYGYNGEPGRVEDYWILDVDGTRLVLITTTGPSSPPEDVEQLGRVFDSVRIVP
ncbi:MAG TPA: hypothetical protein VFV42_08195 [Acidimicrobiales bacterium]|nr:hypothetical protein [Acidimicrobiales bacterium]